MFYMIDLTGVFLFDPRVIITYFRKSASDNHLFGEPKKATRE